MENEKLKIILLTCKNPIDNSGILAYDWYKCLQNEGHTVLLISQYYDARLEKDMLSIYGKFESFIRKRIRSLKHRFGEKLRTDSSYCMHSLNEIKNYIPTKKVINLLPFQPDLFIYIFSHGFLNARNLYELNQQTGSPICIAPVDMAEFTGGCHYTNGCKGFEENCGNCPGLISKKSKDQTFLNLQYKKNYISKTNLFTVTNTWTSAFIKRSSIYAGKPDYPSNVVINKTSYLPGDKDEAKNFFSIPAHKNIIFFGANYIQEKRKGFAYLVDAMNALYQELDEKERSQIGIAIAGSNNAEIEKLFSFDVFDLGQLSHNKLNKAFQMADVFVSPSIQDAGPMMVVQSMMCGTPVVVFEMGNSVDYVIDGKTGFQAALYDSKGLKEGISKLLFLDLEKKKEISLQCRKLAVRKSSYKSFSKDFMELFNNFTANN